MKSGAFWNHEKRRREYWLSGRLMATHDDVPQAVDWDVIDWHMWNVIISKAFGGP